MSALFVWNLLKGAIRGRERLTLWIHPIICLCCSDTVLSLDSVGSPVAVRSNNSIWEWLCALASHTGSTGGHRDSRIQARRLSAHCGMQRSSAAHVQAQAQTTWKCPLYLLVGISLKCQIVHLEQVTQTFGDLLGECQNTTANLWIKCNVHRLLMAWPEGGEVRHPGLRQLGHAVLTECTWNLRLCSVS